MSTTLTRRLTALRNATHPIHRLRSFPPTRALLRTADIEVWRRVEGIGWPVRVRLVSHASFVVLGTPEPCVTTAFREVVQSRDVARFWDVGANFGFYSWLFKTLRPDGHVTLVEPDARNLGLIDRTVRRNDLADVTVLPAAASSHTGVAGFVSDPDGGFRGTIAPGGAVEVATVVLDALPDAVDLIKIDVEGHERDVLDGAMQKLALHRPHVLVECSHPDARCLDRVLRELDYSSAALDDANYLLVPR